MTRRAGPHQPPRNLWELLDGRSITSIARRAGIPQSTASYIFGGRQHQLGLRRGLALARALGCRPDELLQAVERARDQFLARQRALGLIAEAVGRGRGRAHQVDEHGRYRPS